MRTRIQPSVRPDRVIEGRIILQVERLVIVLVTFHKLAVNGPYPAVDEVLAILAMVTMRRHVERRIRGDRGEQTFQPA